MSLNTAKTFSEHRGWLILTWSRPELLFAAKNIYLALLTFAKLVVISLFFYPMALSIMSRTFYKLGVHSTATFPAPHYILKIKVICPHILFGH